MTSTRPYTPDDHAAVAQINASYYGQVHGFDAAFSGAVSNALDAITPMITQGLGAGWVVEHAGAPEGSIFLTPDAGTAGRIRLFFLQPHLHGRELGRDLLTRCLQTAPTLGFTTLRVSTFTIHTAACTLYERSGFTHDGQSSQHMFGQDLTQVDFVKPCASPL